MKKSHSVDSYISDHAKWSSALMLIQDIVMKNTFEESIKWGVPVYSMGGKNIIAMAAFKNYVGLWFYQGAMLKDKHNKFFNAQEGKTKALRQWRFSSIDEIVRDQDDVVAYINEAIENHKQGKSIKPQKKPTLEMAKELDDQLKKNVFLKNAIAGFTVSKQREFSDYINDAKRQITKQNRLTKIIPMIMKGEGLNDKYRK